MRFVEYSGSVTLGGHELRELVGDEVRSVIGLCEQSAHVFDSTIIENLRLARPDVTNSEIASVLERVRLGDWISGLPAGVDTWVGEHGSRLSGGQRQRLALARVLLVDPSITVLDEPTEHLVEATAALLTGDILAATDGRTTLLVTHRLQGLEDLDEIVVLDSGTVTERGSHDELMRQGGWYAAARGRNEDRARPGGG
jgi:ABC-type multidrug transport system fused ATPase/permease subunit